MTGIYPAVAMTQLFILVSSDRIKAPARALSSMPPITHECELDRDATTQHVSCFNKASKDRKVQVIQGPEHVTKDT